MTIRSIVQKTVAAARRLWSRCAPLAARVEPLETVVDLCCRTRRDLVLENGTLRHQVNVLRRNVRRPRLRVTDRLRLLVEAALLLSWREAITIVRPETILRWHRAGYRLFWRHKSKPRPVRRLDAATIDLIREMAKGNHLWGAERIRGELLKDRSPR